MADIKDTAKGATTTAKPIFKPTLEPTFTKQQFLDNAEALGYSKPILVGAFFNAKKDSFTKREVDNLVNSFLKKGVK